MMQTGVQVASMYAVNCTAGAQHTISLSQAAQRQLQKFGFSGRIAIISMQIRSLGGNMQYGTEVTASELVSLSGNSQLQCPKVSLCSRQQQTLSDCSLAV